MSRRERLPFSGGLSTMSTNIMRNSENMMPPKFPALKSKKGVLANSINRDINKQVLSKSALERQRENASKLASGRSVVDKADKENAGVRSKPIKQQFPSRIQPLGKNNKVKEFSEDTKSKFVRSESLSSISSLYTLEEVKKVEKKVLINVENADVRLSKPIKIEEPVLRPVKLDKIEEILEPKVEDKKITSAVELCNVNADNRLTKPNKIEDSKVVEEEKKIPSAVEVINKEEEEHCFSEFLLEIYADDIHRYMKHLEEVQPIRKEYLTSSHIMKQNMRSLLVDWLFEVQQILRLLNETIHLAIALIDRYMQDHPNVSKNEIQLVGVSCIFLASKYEEMYPPDLEELVDIAAKTYTSSQIMKMEMVIFSSLNYQMGRPSPAQFLRRYARAGKVDIVTYCLAKYFVDLSLVSYSLCHVPPSLMAASALYLSLFLLSSESESWTPTLVSSSEYSWDDIRPVVHKLASTVWENPHSKYEAVKNKYLDPKKMHSVSALPELRSEKLYNLATEWKNV